MSPGEAVARSATKRAGGRGSADACVRTRSSRRCRPDARGPSRRRSTLRSRRRSPHQRVPRSSRRPSGAATGSGKRSASSVAISSPPTGSTTRSPGGTPRATGTRSDPAPLGSRDRQRETGLGAFPAPTPHAARGGVLRDRRRPLRNAVDEQLRSWWHDNPFLSGVHWTSGIEMGLRLIAWTWIRRLLDAWPPVRDLFERNETAVRQIFWHQQYLARFRSGGSSANNHVIAEAAGQPRRRVRVSVVRRERAVARRRREAVRARAREQHVRQRRQPGARDRVPRFRRRARVRRRTRGRLVWRRACRSDMAGAVCSYRRGRRASRLDGATAASGRRRRRSRAPVRRAGFERSLLVAASRPRGDGIRCRRVVADGEARRAQHARRRACAVNGAAWRAGRRQKPSHFPDAGITILRTGADEPEIWCRCDAGPHGFLSIAAHAHADALSIEVRHDGVDVLADPGTYCYHGEPEWRSYFRSTSAHNTVAPRWARSVPFRRPLLVGATRQCAARRGRLRRRRAARLVCGTRRL